jgi:polyketide synthase 12/epothilone polyketide synthase D
VALQLINTASAEENLFYQLDWKSASLEETAAPDPGQTLVLAAEEDSDMGLAAALRDALPGLEITTELPAAWDGVRSKIVVLWGSRVLDRRAATVASLNEKAIGLLQSLQKSGSAADVTFVTRGAKAVEPGAEVANPAAAPLSALGLVAQNEADALVCRSIDLPVAPGGDEARWITAEVAAGSRGEIAWRDAGRFVNVMSPQAESPAAEPVERSVEEPVALRSEARGRLDALVYESCARPDPGEGEVEIRVHAVGLNYKDLLKIEGRLNPLAYEGTFNGAAIGMECAGVVLRAGMGSRFQPGDRVAAMVRDGFRSYLTVPETFVVKLPEGMSMEEGASVPVVFMAAYRGLVEVANVQAGERVLIHHATGGVGLAAVAIARWKGCEIFATAGSEEKRSHLRELGIEHVFSSRDLDFGRGIREATGGEGVDVVIGAQAGQALHTSLGLLRAAGRYVEIGKKDIVEDNGLPMRPFNQNLVFASVDLDRLMKEQPVRVLRLMETVFAHLEAGDFRPVPTRALPARQIQEAFREMALSRHIGKLTIDFSGGSVPVIERPANVPIVRRDASYLVTGGTSGFGAVTARWLAEQGAGRVILVSRSGPRAEGVDAVLRGIEAAGAQAEAISVDVSDPAQVRELIARENAASLPLRGIVHGAMVLDDAMLADVTPESFRRVFQPKAAGALNIAESAADSTLDFLVFYSSVSALIGNRGQTSYVVANALLDALAQDLRARGLPALSMNWGALAESGVVARDGKLGAVLSSAGITGLGNRQALDALGKAIRAGRAQLGAFLLDWEQWRDAHPRLADDPKFRDLCLQSADAGGGDAASQLRETMAGFSKEQKLRALEEHLQDVLATTLKMAKDHVPVDRKLNEMGVDSLLVLELSLGIKERIGIHFSAMEFLKGPSIQQLASLAESRLWNN